jgi:hypothetical protein
LADREIDLSEVYDDQRRRREKVRGLIETLSRYKFTVENTRSKKSLSIPNFGKVFENLLASYNEDTRTTARRLRRVLYPARNRQLHCG